MSHTPGPWHTEEPHVVWDRCGRLIAHTHASVCVRQQKRCQQWRAYRQCRDCGREVAMGREHPCADGCVGGDREVPAGVYLVTYQRAWEREMRRQQD